MVIFHTDHWGAIAHFIVLAVNYHYDDDKLLIYTENDKCKKQVAERWVETGIFNKIIFSNEIQHPGDRLHDKLLIEKAILEKIDFVLHENNIDINLVQKIYSSTDIDGIFRYYLAKKKKHYTLVMLSEKDIYENYKSKELYDIGDVTSEYMDLLNENHIYDGTSEFCDSIIAFPSTPLENNKIKKKIVKFDLGKEIEKISEVMGEKILNSFGTSISEIEQYKRILLSNSGGYLWRSISAAGYDAKDILEHTLIYQELIDFYSLSTSDNIVIKAHPNNGVNWHKYFFGITEINRDMPIELIKLSRECYLSEVIALQTSAVDKIQNRVKKVILATVDFALYYHLICKLYILCKIYFDLQIQKPLHEWGFSEKFFDAFIKYVFENIGTNWSLAKSKLFQEGCFKIYKDLSVMDTFDAYRFIRAMDNDSALAVINVSPVIPLYRLKNIPNVYTLVFRVQKDPIKSEVLLPLEDEYIIIFTKSFELKEKLKRETIDKTLQVTGVQMHAEALSEFAKERYFQELYRKNELYAIEKYMDILTDFIKRGSVYSLKNIIDFEAYLASLRLIKDAVILISVKDNAGKNFTHTAVKYWKALGLKTDIDILGWNSYLAIIDADNVTYEAAGQREEPSEYSTKFCGMELKMYSRSYNKGNLASILIEGKECAVNGRGINIVVYDKLNRQICDSVAFDTFLPIVKCSRK